MFPWGTRSVTPASIEEYRKHSRIVYEDIQLSSTSIRNIGFRILDGLIFGYVEFDAFKTFEVLELRHRLEFSRTGYDLVSFAVYM
jgi:hypothetical protein